MALLSTGIVSAMSLPRPVLAAAPSPLVSVTQSAALLAAGESFASTITVRNVKPPQP